MRYMIFFFNHDKPVIDCIVDASTFVSVRSLFPAADSFVCGVNGVCKVQS